MRLGGWLLGFAWSCRSALLGWAFLLILLIDDIGCIACMDDTPGEAQLRSMSL